MQFVFFSHKPELFSFSLKPRLLIVIISIAMKNNYFVQYLCDPFLEHLFNSMNSIIIQDIINNSGNI